MLHMLVMVAAMNSIKLIHFNNKFLKLKICCKCSSAKEKKLSKFNKELWKKGTKVILTILSYGYF